MNCLRCNEELKINWITKEAECMSCHHHYHIKYRKMNLLTWLVCIIILAGILTRIMMLLSGGNQYIWFLVYMAFLIPINILMPRKLTNRFIYKLYADEKE